MSTPSEPHTPKKGQHDIIVMNNPRTPTRKLMLPTHIDVDQLPKDFRKTLSSIWNETCDTCSQLNQQRGNRCHQSSERTWKCNHCYTNNIECSWMTSKYGLYSTHVLMRLTFDQNASTLVSGISLPSKLNGLSNPTPDTAN